MGGLLTLSVLVACGDPGPGPNPDAGAIQCTSFAQCEDGLYCNGVSRCAPEDPAADESGCVAGAPPCVESEVCDEAARRCVESCDAGGDRDGDGHVSVACGGTDCDDDDANRFVGNLEVCDAFGHDEDCDARTLGVDRDDDGVESAACCNRLPSGALACGRDCDDENDEIKPGAPEICNLADDDCDGTMDEGLEAVAYYPDCDGDLYGFDDGSGFSACTPPATPPAVCAGRPGAAWSNRSTDCDDGSAMVNPNRTEICALGVDDDCDGALHPNEDADGDGWINVACGGQDCDDGNAQTFLGAPELCDGEDNDCDGAATGEDLDRDGELAESAACAGGPLASLPRTDCDDADPTLGRGLAEMCDGRDNDCDGVPDELPDADSACPTARHACVRGECLRCTGCDLEGPDRTYWYLLTALAAAADPRDGLDVDGRPTVCGAVDVVSADGERDDVDNSSADLYPALPAIGLNPALELTPRITDSTVLRLVEVAHVDGCTDDHVEVRIWVGRAPIYTGGALNATDGALDPGQRVDWVGAIPIGSFEARIDGGRLVPRTRYTELQTGYVDFQLDETSLTLDERVVFGSPHVAAGLEACMDERELADGVLGGVIAAEDWIQYVAQPATGIDPDDVRNILRSLSDVELNPTVVECNGLSAGYLFSAVHAIPGVRWAN